MITELQETLRGEVDKMRYGFRCYDEETFRYPNITFASSESTVCSLVSVKRGGGYLAY